MKQTQRAFLIALWLVAACVAPSALADGDDVRTKERVKGEGNGARVELRTQVKTICDALDKAARKPGQKFSHGNLQFIGHEPWVAKLICDYVTKAQPQQNGNPPDFAEEKERRAFVGVVLDALDKNAKIQTRAIGRDRVLVGEKVYRLQVRERADGEREGPPPEKVNRMDVARSIENTDVFLLAMAKRNFGNEGDQKKLLDWLKAGEAFVLRMHVLAESVQALAKTNLDWPTQDMGRDLVAASLDFQKKYSLLNTDARATYKEWGDAFRAEDKVETDRQRQRRQNQERAPNDPTFVDLKIVQRQAPVPGSNGLSLFEYAPIRGAERPGQVNPQAWYVQALAQDIGSNEAGGITLPMWKISFLDVNSLAFPDRLLDETTKAKVETRITVLASCAVRILYYHIPNANKDDPNGLTTRAAVHERKHFKGIQTAWDAAMVELRGDLQKLAGDLNLQLGLAAGEAFQFQSSTVMEAWKPDKNKADLTAIPEGKLARGQSAAILDLQPAVQVLRLRLVRTTGEEESGESLLAKLTAQKPLDPKLSDVKTKWDAWVTSPGPKYRNHFVRDFLLAALQLDLTEGALTDAGQVGRPDLRPVLEGLKAAIKLPGFENKDPQALVDALMARHKPVPK